MNKLVLQNTATRWEREDAESKADIKREAAETAVTFANSVNFTTELRRAARKLNVADFIERGDVAMSAKRLMDDPDFGDMLVEMLTDRDLIDEDDEHLSNEAEVFVEGFFEGLSDCLNEYDSLSGKK